MAKRMNVVFQDETAETVVRAAKPGERSRYIDRAVQHYAATHSPAALREQLKESALRDRDLGEAVARDWFAVDREPWPNPSPKERPGRRPSRSAVKYTS